MGLRAVVNSDGCLLSNCLLCLLLRPRFSGGGGHWEGTERERPVHHFPEHDSSARICRFGEAVWRWSRGVTAHCVLCGHRLKCETLSGLVQYVFFLLCSPSSLQERGS